MKGKSIRALIDTQVFLWWINGEGHIPDRTRDIIAAGVNDLYFSTASILECVLKTEMGILVLFEHPEGFIREQLLYNGFLDLPVLPTHADHVFKLPRLHRDLFDRILIAQAQIEGMSIITPDPLIRQYDHVVTIWD